MVGCLIQLYEMDYNFHDARHFSILQRIKEERVSHKHTHKVQQTRSFINMNYLIYMSTYAFIYARSILKQTLMDLLCGLILCPLIIKPK